MNKKTTFDDNYGHLYVKTVEKLSYTKEERIADVRSDKWIWTDDSEQVFKELNHLVTGPDVVRPPCRLIVAESNSGKSALVKKFMEAHPVDENIAGETIIARVIAITARGPDEKGLWQAILNALFDSASMRSSASEARNQAHQLIKKIKPRLIIIDEVHELFKGNKTQVMACQSAIKGLNTVLSRSVAVFGTREALDSLRKDEQLENRFVPLFLNTWKWNAETRELLKNIEALLPLPKASQLYDTKKGMELIRRTSKDTVSGSKLGEIMELVRSAAIYAIENELSSISMLAIKRCSYVPMYTRVANYK